MYPKFGPRGNYRNRNPSASCPRRDCWQLVDRRSPVQTGVVGEDGIRYGGEKPDVVIATSCVRKKWSDRMKKSTDSTTATSGDFRGTLAKCAQLECLTTILKRARNAMPVASAKCYHRGQPPIGFAWVRAFSPRSTRRTRIVLLPEVPSYSQNLQATTEAMGGLW